MRVEKLDIADVIEITPRRFGDERGFFSETYSKQKFSSAGIDIEWVQDNHSRSEDAFVLRGLHFQLAPFAQDKLVRVLRGAIFDVAVDLRKDSPSFGTWTSRVLTAAEGNQLLVPRGFAHGFLTLEPGVEVAYKVSAPYSPAHDRSLRWNDPSIAIDWPLHGNEPILSPKDRDAPSLAELAGQLIF